MYHFHAFKATKYLPAVFWLLCAAFTLQAVQAQSELPLYVKITGKLPQLAWSTGTDRLGSAKMGYIDTGIILQVADTVGSLYKIKLSAHRHAFIEKSLVSPIEMVMKPAIATAESWRIKGGDGPDSLTINLGRKVAYQSWMETRPSRIVLELYGVQANTNWITQLRSTREVASVDYRQVEDDAFHVVIHLKHTQHYGYHIAYRGNQMLLTARVPPQDKKLKGKLIVIDAGHGGTNMGARGGTSDILEKDYTLLYAKALEKTLKEKGVRVLMVRDKDTLIDNKDRVLWTIAQNPDLFISIHFNSAGRKEVRGTSTYYKNVAFKPLAASILNQLLEINDLQEFGLVGSFNFQPVQPTEYPSCLVEVAFLSNPEDEKMVMNIDFRNKVAKEIKLGIQHWFDGIRELDIVAPRN